MSREAFLKNLNAHTTEIVFPCPEAEKPRMFLSLQAAGDMKLTCKRNRDNYLTALLATISCRTIRHRYALRQIHSRKVYRTGGNYAVREGNLQGDALICDEADALLSVTVADCLPIFLIDFKKRALAAIHSGWQGTGIAVDAAEMMGREFSSRPEDLVAVIGPGIGPCCYAVDRERYDYFGRTFGPPAVQTRGGNFYLDMQTANINLLKNHGLDRLYTVRLCTACTPQLGSFRRDGRENFKVMLACLGWM